MKDTYVYSGCWKCYVLWSIQIQLYSVTWYFITFILLRRAIFRIPYSQSVTKWNSLLRLFTMILYMLCSRCVYCHWHKGPDLPHHVGRHFIAVIWYEWMPVNLIYELVSISPKFCSYSWQDNISNVLFVSSINFCFNKCIVSYFSLLI